MSVVDCSICIPSYNRVEELGALLASLVPELKKVADEGVWTVEVVVVLDGSVDDSQTMVEQQLADYPVELRCRWQENQGRSAARNRLVDMAGGGLLWFLDDDMIVLPGALERHLRWDRSVTDVMFGPSYVIGPNEGLALFYEDRWENLASLTLVTKPELVLFSNTTVPAGVFARHRFDESFVGYGFEDYELALRMLGDGVKFGFDVAAKVQHDTNKSGFASLKDIREEGANRVRVARMHPEAGAFALDLRSGRLAGMLLPVARRGFSRPLWFMAHVIRPLATLFSGRRRFHVIRIADDFALYSGLARAWRLDGGRSL